MCLAFLLAESQTFFRNYVNHKNLIYINLVSAFIFFFANSSQVNFTRNKFLKFILMLVSRETTREIFFIWQVKKRWCPPPSFPFFSQSFLYNQSMVITINVL